jgi:outer membrane protein assembly factor BamA
VCSAFVVGFSSATPGGNAQNSPKYRIATIKVTGANTMGQERASRALRLRSGSRIREGDIESAVEALRREYFKYGFIKVRVSVDKQIRPANSQEEYPLLDVSVNVIEGLHYFVAAISFHGNAKTSHRVVQRATGLNISDAYNPDDIARWVAGLNRLERFYPVSKDDVEARVDNETGQAFLDFHLKEKAR